MVKFKKHKKARINNLKSCNEKYKNDKEEAKVRTNKGAKTKLLSSFKSIFRRKPRDIYKEVPAKQEFAHVVKHIIDKTRPLIQCSHLYVGSATIIDLLRSELTPLETHRIYVTKGNRDIGKVAENLVGQSLKDYTKECRASYQLPFLCATPDFVLDDRVIEVKNRDQVTPEILLQILISMEIFGKEYGEILLFRTNQRFTGFVPLSRSLEFNPAAPYNVQLLGIIGVTRTESLFTQEFIEYSCTGYIHYLLLCFNLLGKNVDPEIIKESKEQLLLYASQKTPGGWKLPAHHTTIYCKAFLKDQFPLIHKYDHCIKPIWKYSKRLARYSEKTQERRCIHRNERFNRDHYLDVPFHSSIYSQYVEDKNAKTMKEEEFIDLSGRSAPATRSKEKEPLNFTVIPSAQIVREEYTFDQVTFGLLTSECRFDRNTISTFPFRTWDFFNYQRS